MDGPRITRVAGKGPYPLSDYPYETRTTVNLLGLSPDADGFLWGRLAGSAVRFDPGSLSAISTFVAGSLEWALLDEAGALHGSVRTVGDGFVIRRQAGDGWTDFAQARAIGPDLSRRQLHALAQGHGRWSQLVNGVTAGATWSALSWTASIPADARLAVTVRFAATVLGLEHPGTICGPAGIEGYLDLGACTDGAPYHFARIDVDLFAGQQGAGPIVRDMRLAWSRP
jgi:hypothetical protein